MHMRTTLNIDDQLVRRAARLTGITEKTFEVAPYMEVLNKEAEIVGVSDHLAQELPQLLEWARRGALDLSGVITRTLPLDARAVNEALDGLEQFGEEGRMVITPKPAGAPHRRHTRAPQC